MTRLSRPEDLLREMRGSVVPVDSPEGVEARRARTVARLRDLQAQTRATRQLETSWRKRMLIAAAVFLPSAAAAATWAGWAGSTSGGAEALAPRTTLHVVRGAVTLTHDGHDVAARGTEVLGALDRVHTARNAEAEVVLPSGADVDAAESSELSVASAAQTGAERVELALGRVDVHVPRLEAGKSFLVHTPDATVTVHGTRFSVVVAEAGSHTTTTVGVTEGIVSVEHDGSSVKLLAGDSWSSAAVVAAKLEDPRPAPTEGETAVRAVPGASNTRSVGPRSAPAERSTLAAENALMQRALGAGRQGDDARSVALLDELLAKYPGSPLAQNAKVERFRALERIGNTSAASREARRYLGEHPDGMASDEARRLAVQPAGLDRSSQ